MTTNSHSVPRKLSTVCGYVKITAIETQQVVDIITSLRVYQTF